MGKGSGRDGDLHGQPWHTLGVCDFTFPARASEPWTLPMIAFVVDVDGSGFGELLWGGQS